MPTCRNCGARLSKFDNDICPVCGTEKPLEGVNSETIEITSQVDISGFKEGQRIVRRRKTMLMLALFLGWTGAPFFYIKKVKLALFWTAFNLIILGSLFALFYFVVNMYIVLAITLPIVFVYLYNIGCGIFFYRIKDLKDGEGEFVV